MLQGVQILMGADDAWGGFAAKMSEALRDEMVKGAIWAWGIEEEVGRATRVGHPCRRSRFAAYLFGRNADYIHCLGQTADEDSQYGEDRS